MTEIKNNLSEKKCAYIRNTVFLILIFVLEIFFFRELLQSGAMLGDCGDGRLNNLIMEHWYHVFCGNESINTLSQFYPVTNTLSYTDMLLGFSIPYSVLRFFGVSMFKANKLVLIGVHFLGSYCLYFLLHKIYKLKDYAAFAAVTAFSFANGYAVRTCHTQMMALSFLPLILIFASMTVKCWNNNKARRIYAMLFVTTYGLLAYTGWYTFFFSAIFLLVIMISCIIHIFTNNRLLFLEIWNSIKKRIVELCCYAVWMVALLLPFLYWYLPTSKMSGSRKWEEEVIFYLPNFTDIANVGGGNRLLGKFIDSLKFSQYRVKGEKELMQGFSIVLLILMAILIWKLIHEYKKKKILQQKIETDEVLYVSYARALMFSLILVVECAGMSLWWFIWKFVPGAGALRAVSRWYYFLLLPISILFAVLIDRYSRGRKEINYFVIVMVATFCLWCSNVYAGDISNWNYADDLNLIESVQPPEGATIIAMMDSSETPQDLALTNLDAWLIADHYGIQTINGYSGTFPENYGGIWNVNVPQEEYLSMVQEWRELHQITDTVYVYDRNTKKWLKVSVPL